MSLLDELIIIFSLSSNILFKIYFVSSMLIEFRSSSVFKMSLSFPILRIRNTYVYRTSESAWGSAGGRREVGHEVGCGVGSGAQSGREVRVNKKVATHS